MSRRQFALTLVAVSFFGLVGGFLGARFQQPQARAESAGLVLASELRLVDDSGRTRALLSLLRGKPRFIMLDDNGEFRMEFGLGGAGEPQIWMRDREGRVRTRIFLNETGGPGIRFLDSDGKARTAFGLSQSGSPTLILRDESGRDRVALWQEEGELGLSLADSAGLPRASLAIKQDRPSMAIYDTGGKPVWFAPSGSR
jgi:hypothetical protein